MVAIIVIDYTPSNREQLSLRLRHQGHSLPWPDAVHPADLKRLVEGPGRLLGRTGHQNRTIDLADRLEPLRIVAQFLIGLFEVRDVLRNRGHANAASNSSQLLPGEPAFTPSFPSISIASLQPRNSRNLDV